MATFVRPAPPPRPAPLLAAVDAAFVGRLVQAELRAAAADPVAACGRFAERAAMRPIVVRT